MSDRYDYSSPFDPPEGGWPVREELLLDDEYATGVFHHAPPDGASTAPPVVYLHGIQSHPGWFFGSARRLAMDGHDVFQVTRRGSGANIVGRGDAQSAGRILGDVERAVRFALERTGSQRAILLGVSWGGKLAAAYAVMPSYRRAIASLVLVAPGIVPRVDVSFGTKLAIAASLLLYPRWTHRIPLDDPELFTDNEEMREFIRRDPMSLRRASAGFLYASRRLDRMISREPGGVIDVPITLILSDGDRIIDSDATAKVIERLAVGHLEIVRLPGAHTQEFNADPAAFHQALVTACRK